jgi:hypothetical protein
MFLQSLAGRRGSFDISHKIRLIKNLPVDGGGFGHVGLGLMDGKLVRSLISMTSAFMVLY